jgi:hypothetical protein
MIPYYKLIVGGTNGERFIDFLKSLYSQAKQSIGQKLVYYLDNATCHHYKLLKEFIVINNIHVIYGVVYISEYNMSECVFNTIKTTYYSMIIKNEYY